MKWVLPILVIQLLAPQHTIANPKSGGAKPPLLYESPPDPSPVAPSTGPRAGDLLLHRWQVTGFSGEFRCSTVDFHIKGRGLDFIWARRYLSRAGPNTAMGNGWVHCYDIRIERKKKNVILHNGWGRQDVLQEDANGAYGADEHFVEGRFNRGLQFTVTFPDGGVWEFLPLDDSPAEGRIARIADRNGNALKFNYDELGRLWRVTDTLERPIVISYNSDGFIQQIEDFTGRTVTYEYYAKGDTDGTFGSLKAATLPAIIATPNANDFPNGLKTVYSYSVGGRRAELNGNLRSIQDPRGHVWLRVGYFDVTDPNDLNFDRAKTVDLADESTTYSYVRVTPGVENNSANFKTIVNDRMGNVREQFYDEMNRCVMARAFTGRATPGIATTETENRPTGRVRAQDPLFFETRWRWNSDALVTLVRQTAIDSLEIFIFPSAIDSNAPRRSRANLLEYLRFPGSLGGDQEVLSEKLKYDPRFNFVTEATDARGKVSSYAYDERGNVLRKVHRDPEVQEEFEYNEFGQLTAHTAPDNGTGHRRRTEFVYYRHGHQAGYVEEAITDAGVDGLNITIVYEYDSLGNVVRRVDPRGHDTLFLYNQLDLPVRISSRPLLSFREAPVRALTEIWYDPAMNPVRVCRSNQDENGALSAANPYITELFEFDSLNRLIRACREFGTFDVPRIPPKVDCADLPASEFATTEYEYDANGNPGLMRLPGAVAGEDPFEVVRFLYDERNLPFQQIRAPNHPDQSTSQWDYDANGNIIRIVQGLEGIPRETVFAYDGFNRRTRTVDPMGNTTLFTYDPNGNALSISREGELLDSCGRGNNVLLAKTLFTYDDMDRPVRGDRLFFDPLTQAPFGDGVGTTLWTYNGLFQLLTATDDNNNRYRWQYDRANRLHLQIDPRGNSVNYEYDANSNVIAATSSEKSDLQGPDQHFTTVFAYDPVDRLVAITDNAENTKRYAYDSRNNLTSVRDALQNETRYVYDGLSRQIAGFREGHGVVQGADSDAPIIIGAVWNSSSRLIRQTDSNGNPTQYRYDPLGRVIEIAHPDGKRSEYNYDLHDNLVSALDANGSSFIRRYDLLDRLIRLEITPGRGVSDYWTFSDFSYDGRSRLVEAVNDISVVTFRYDSHGNILRESLNGQESVSSYDSVGNRLTARYPGGRQFFYSYDSLNRLSELSDGIGWVASFDYVGDRVERRALGNRTETHYGHDAAKNEINAVYQFRISGDTGGTWLDAQEFSWDSSYNLLVRANLRPNGLSHSYRYDSSYRLIHSTIENASLGLRDDSEYMLDPVGNRRAVIVNGASESYFMDPSTPSPADLQGNRYTLTPFDARIYDANGNPTTIATADAEIQLSYDAADRLVRSVDSVSGSETTYGYDAVGRRIVKSFQSPGTEARVTRYFWRGWQETEEQDALGQTIGTFVHGPSGLDDLVQIQRGGNSFFLHNDSRGSTLAMSAQDGSIVERYDYNDFGEPFIFDPNGNRMARSSAGNSHFLHGRPYDDETGLYYFRARYYEPEIGRYLSRNLLGAWFDPDNLGNPYSFVAVNPHTRTDPTGLSSAHCPTCSIKTARFTVPPAAHGDSRGFGFVTFSSPEAGLGFLDEYVEGGFNPAANASPPSFLGLKYGIAKQNRAGSVGTHEVGYSFALHLTFAGRSHGHLDFLKKVGDPASGEPIGSLQYAAGDTATHEYTEVKRWNLHHAWPAMVGGYPEIAGNFKDTADGETGAFLPTFVFRTPYEEQTRPPGSFSAPNGGIWKTTSAAHSSLYFPESMLQEISEGAVPRGAHPDFLWFPYRVSARQHDARVYGYHGAAGGYSLSTTMLPFNPKEISISKSVSW